MFIDRVTIEIRGGKGGNGCVSFRREKHVPRGGPDGGDGGRGGDVIVRVDPQLRTLLDLRYRRTYRAGNGKHGQGSRKTGRGGADVIVDVPPGTILKNSTTDEQVADLVREGQDAVVARGGRGGKGNYGFRTSTDQAPRRSTDGEPGEELLLEVTLKLIADVGLVGLPNAGKSTLLRRVSDAHPVVAPYPFSTVTPVLGIVPVDVGASFCMVDIPGLIEGAHEGKGLGIQFLQHIERCSVLLFLLDAAGDVHPGEAYEQLIREVGLYSERLLDRPRFVALNKMDLIEGQDQEDLPDSLQGESVFSISALSGDGVGPLVTTLFRAVQDLQSSP